MLLEIISPDAWAGIIGAVVGAIVGWLLSTISNYGCTKIEFVNTKVEFSDIDLPNNPNTLKIEFVMRIVNNKTHSFGINSAEVLINRGREDEPVGIDIFGSIDEKNELGNLLNVPAKETREAKYESGQTILYPEHLQKYKIFVRYKFNGRRFYHKRKIYET